MIQVVLSNRLTMKLMKVDLLISRVEGSLKFTWDRGIYIRLLNYQNMYSEGLFLLSQYSILNFVRRN